MPLAPPIRHYPAAPAFFSDATVAPVSGNLSLVPAAFSVVESESPALTIDVYRSSDTPGILACLRASFGGTPDEARWRHLHRANPVGPSVIVVARAQDDVVGQIASLRRRVRFFGSEHTIAHVVDTMVHPAWQRRGVLRDLVHASEAAVAQKGLLASYGVANDAARHAALKYEHRQPLGAFPVLVRPLRPLASVAALYRHYTGGDPAGDAPSIPECAAAGPLPHPADAPVLVEVGDGAWTAPRFDDRHTWLFARAGDLPPIAFMRDADHLGWRYPSSTAGVYAQRDLVDGGKIVATAVVRLVSLAGLRFAFLMEWHWERGAARAARGLVDEAIALARRAGAHGVAAMAAHGSMPRRILRGAGFLAVPTRAIPQGAWPGIHVRGTLGGDPRWSAGSNWHFTWGDSLVL